MPKAVLDDANRASKLVTDTTAAGTFGLPGVPRTEFPVFDSAASKLGPTTVTLNHNVLFTAENGNLWSTDGTVAGSARISSTVEAFWLTVLGNKVLFSGSTS